jgi:hypothetical protein
MITTTQQQLKDRTFHAPLFQRLQNMRLFSILPIPSLSRKFIQVSHQSLAEIMRHFNLANYVKSNSKATANVVHENFKIFNMEKVKKG